LLLYAGADPEGTSGGDGLVGTGVQGAEGVEGWEMGMGRLKTDFSAFQASQNAYR